MPFTPAVIVGPPIKEPPQEFIPKTPRRSRKDPELDQNVESEIAPPIIRSARIPVQLPPIHTAVSLYNTANSWRFPHSESAQSQSSRMLFTAFRRPPNRKNAIDSAANPSGPPRIVERSPVVCPQGEFFNAIDYLESLSPHIEAYGAIKIAPPDYWDPCKAIHGDNFWFNATRQVFNSPDKMESGSESTEFLKALTYWHDQTNTDFRIPVLDKRPLDLFRLFRIVHSKGGHDQVSKRKQWAQVGREMGYAGRISSSLSSSLRAAYRRTLRGFDLFLVEHNIRADLTVCLLQFQLSDRNGLLIGFEPIKKTGIKEPVEEHLPYYNLRQFDSRSAEFDAKKFNGKKPSPAALEASYWQAMENDHFEVEKAMANIFEPPKPKDDWRKDPWNAERLPWISGLFSKYISSDYTPARPRYDIGMTFTTLTWRTVETTEISWGLWGAPTSWYVIPPSAKIPPEFDLSSSTPPTPHQLKAHGVPCYYIDQDCRDIVVVSPGSRVYQWCHGCTLRQSVSILLTSDLSYLQAHATPNLCLEHILINALRQAIDVETVLAVEKLLPQIASITDSLLSRYDATETLDMGPDDPLFIECGIRRTLEHWCWVQSDGKTYSVRAAIESGIKGKLMRRQPSMTDFVSTLIKDAHRRLLAPTGSVGWQIQVEKYLLAHDDTNLSLSEVIRLADCCPGDYRSLGQASSLRQIASIAVALENSVQDEVKSGSNPVKCIELLKRCIVSPVSISKETWNLLIKGQEPFHDYARDCRSLISELEKGWVTAQSIQVQDFANRTKGFKDHMALARDMNTLITQLQWVDYLISRLSRLSMTIEAARYAMTSQVEKWNIPRESIAVRKLQELIGNYERIEPHVTQWIKEGVYGVNAPKLAAIRNDNYRRYYLLPIEAQRLLQGLEVKLAVIERIGHMNIMKRPVAAELTGYDAHPRVREAIKSFMMYWAEAKSIDWQVVGLRAHKLCNDMPPGDFAEIYSISRVLAASDSARSQGIRPNDIQTILAARDWLVRAKESSPEKLQKYGFTP